MDGKQLSAGLLPRKYYFALNKPKGYICSNKLEWGDDGGRLVVDLFQDWLKEWKQRQPKVGECVCVSRHALSCFVKTLPGRPLGMNSRQLFQDRLVVDGGSGSPTRGEQSRLFQAALATKKQFQREGFCPAAGLLEAAHRMHHHPSLALKVQLCCADQHLPTSVFDASEGGGYM